MLGQNWINTNVAIKAEHTFGVQQTVFATPTVLTSSVVFMALHMSIAKCILRKDSKTKKTRKNLNCLTQKQTVFSACTNDEVFNSVKLLYSTVLERVKAHCSTIAELMSQVGDYCSRS